MNSSIRNAIDNRLSSITVSDTFEEKILSNKITISHKKRKNLAIIVAAILYVTLSVTVVAVTLSSFDKLTPIVNPQTIDNLQPVELYTESNGIKMEVVASMNDNEMAVVYLTMQDLISNRINESIDLYDYNITGLNIFTHELVDYDETTKTATIRMLAAGGRDLNDKEINLRISSFLTGSKTFEKFDTKVNLVDVSSDVDTIDLNMLQIPGGGGDKFDDLKEKRIVNILKTDEMNIELPNISFAYISNIGFIDDKLHVQVKWTKKETEKANIDDHGTFSLIANNKTIIPTNIEFSVDEYGNTKYGNGYSEYIFDVSRQMVSSYSLVADHFETNNNYIEGDWQISFNIKTVNTPKKVDCDINIDNIRIKSVSLSPLGITLFAEGKKSDNTDIEVTVASIEQNFSRFFYSSYNQHIIKYIPVEPLNIKNIDVIYINDFAINFGYN